jgi:hypothetical protein
VVLIEALEGEPNWIASIGSIDLYRLEKFNRKIFELRRSDALIDWSASRNARESIGASRSTVLKPRIEISSGRHGTTQNYGFFCDRSTVIASPY